MPLLESKFQLFEVIIMDPFCSPPLHDRCGQVGSTAIEKFDSRFRESRGPNQSLSSWYSDKGVDTNFKERE